MWYYLGAYFLILLVVIWVSSRRAKKEDYLLAGRNRPGWQIFFSKFAASVGVGWFITFTGLAYSHGLTTMAVVIGIVPGYLLFMRYVVPRIYNRAKQNRWYTQGDMVEGLVKSRPARVSVDISSMMIEAAWLLISVIGGAKIISHYGLISYEWAVVITAAVILAYLLLAGFKAVILTDIIQGIVMMGLLALMVFSSVETSIVSELFVAGDSLLWTDVVGFLVFATFSFIVYADRYPLVFAAKNEKSAKQGIGYSMVPVIVVGALLMLLGWYVRSQGIVVDEGLVFVRALEEFLPQMLLPGALVMFFAGLMSSADTLVFTIASQFTFLTKTKRPVALTRYVTIVVMVLAAGISLLWRNVVDATLFASALSMVLVVPIVLAIFYRKVLGRDVMWALGGAYVALVTGIALWQLAPAVAALPIVGGLVGWGIVRAIHGRWGLRSAAGQVS